MTLRRVRQAGSSFVEYLLVLGLVIAAILAATSGTVFTGAQTLLNQCANQIGNGGNQITAMPL